jgi:hypothetical protein
VGLAANGVRTVGTRGQPAAEGAGRCHGAWEQGSGGGACEGMGWSGKG